MTQGHADPELRWPWSIRTLSHCALYRCQCHGVTRRRCQNNTHTICGIDTSSDCHLKQVCDWLTYVTGWGLLLAEVCDWSRCVIAWGMWLAAVCDVISGIYHTKRVDSPHSLSYCALFHSIRRPVRISQFARKCRGSFDDLSPVHSRVRPVRRVPGIIIQYIWAENKLPTDGPIFQYIRWLQNEGQHEVGLILWHCAALCDTRWYCVMLCDTAKLCGTMWHCVTVVNIFTVLFCFAALSYIII